MASTLERLEEAEKSIKTLLEKVGTLDQKAIDEGIGHAKELAELAAQRMLGVEQAAAALGKTLTALTKTLVVKKVLTGDEIMSHIQKIDDDGDRDKITQLLQMKAIEKTTSVGPEDLVVTAQNFISLTDPNQSKSIREYCLIELPQPTIHPTLRKDLTSRKIGDTIQAGKNEKGVYTLTVREIYRIVPPPAGTQTGENQSEQPNTTETPPAAESAAAQASNSEGESANGQQT